MPQRHCLDCGTLSNGSRCPQHTRQRHTAYYGHGWQQRSERERAAHPTCTNCGTTEDLTLDHHIAGDRTITVVLCRPCNTRKSDH